MHRATPCVPRLTDERGREKRNGGQRRFLLQHGVEAPFSLFKTDLREQGHKLTSMINTVVVGLDRIESLVPAVESLGRRHGGYGVRDEHYDTVGQALLWTLATGLSVEDRLRDIYTRFRARRDPKSASLERLAAAGTTDTLEHRADDLLYHEDPYLQDFLGSSGKN